MWIRTQKKDAIVNSDNLVNIRRDYNLKDSMVAMVHGRELYITLGTYTNPEEFNDILENIQQALMMDVPGIDLPKDDPDEIKTWLKNMEEIIRVCMIAKYSSKARIFP